MITKSTRPLSNFERFQQYVLKARHHVLARQEREHNRIWCDHCRRLNAMYTLEGDQQHFCADRVEAIMCGECTCDDQNISEHDADCWETVYRPDYRNNTSTDLPF